MSLVLATFARTFLVQVFEIPSSSMERSLLIGDHVLVNKFVYAPAPTVLERWLLPQRTVRAGDIVVFRGERGGDPDLVKRCVAVGGERVALVDKTLVRNGATVREPYAQHADPYVYPASRFLPEALRWRDNLDELTVPAGELFCLGDNRDQSHDSRFFGTVATGRIRGRAFLVFWSRPPASVAQASVSRDQNPEAAGSARWNRTLKMIE